MDAHIIDIVSLIRIEGLNHMTLMAHSFFGPVAVGEMPGRFAQIVEDASA